MDYIKDIVFGLGAPSPSSKRRQTPAAAGASPAAHELVTNKPFTNSSSGGGVLSDNDLLEVYALLKHSDTDISLSTFENSTDLKEAVSFVLEELLFVSLALTPCSDNINYKINNISNFVTTFFCVPTVMKTLTGTGCYMMVSMADHLATLPTNGSNEKLQEVLVVILARVVLFFKKETQFQQHKATITTIDSAVSKGSHCEMNGLIVDLIVLRLSKVIPYVLTVTEYLPIAMDFFTIHRLGVRALAGDIKATIKRLTLKVRGDLSDEILNGDIAKIKSVLSASVDNFFNWIETNKTALVRECQNAEVVACVDATARAWLRGEEYASAAEIVIAYRQKYRRFLTDVLIVSSRYGEDDISQARKDLRREIVSLNSKSIYSTNYNGKKNSISSSSSSSTDTPPPSPTHAVSKLEADVKVEYMKVLAYLSGIESRSASRSASRDDHGGTSRLSADSGDSGGGGGGVSAVINSSDNSFVLRTASLDSYQPNGMPGIIIGSSDGRDSPCAKSSISGYSPVNISARRANSSDSYDSRRDGHLKDSKSYGARAIFSSRSSFSKFSYRMRMLQRFDRYENLLDLLVNHTLLAASRTCAGGDAFVILEDLYGGEGTVLCPRKRKRTSSSGSSNSGISSSSVESSVDITINCHCAVIRIVEEYDLFSKVLLEQTSDKERNKQTFSEKDYSNNGPLISFRCTTVTVVSFADVDVLVGAGGGGDVGVISSATGEAVVQSNGIIDSLYLTLLSSPDKMVTKRVTIVPIICDDAYRPPKEKL